MALIKCPDCGQDYSDKAKACIHCGAPNPHFKEATLPTKIKLPAFNRVQMIRQNKSHVVITNEEKKERLWEGYASQVAEFIIEEKTRIRIRFEGAIGSVTPSRLAWTSILISVGFLLGMIGGVTLAINLTGGIIMVVFGVLAAIIGLIAIIKFSYTRKNLITDSYDVEPGEKYEMKILQQGFTPSSLRLGLSKVDIIDSRD